MKKISGHKAEKVKAYKRGVWAEYAAAFLLSLKGYRILARRYKTHAGEIDLIAKRGRMIIFVEVKARRELSTALEAISQRSKNRISKAAVSYIQRYPQYDACEMRFDVIAFRSLFSWQHLDNAWQYHT